MAPEGAKSTSVGLTNSLSLSSAIVFQPVIGWILNLLAQQRGSGLNHYSANEYRIALTLLPVMIFMAFIISIYIRKEFKRPR